MTLEIFSTLAYASNAMRGRVTCGTGCDSIVVLTAKGRLGLKRGCRDDEQEAVAHLIIIKR